jgi:hypothetical protein
VLVLAGDKMGGVGEYGEAEDWFIALGPVGRMFGEAGPRSVPEASRLCVGLMGK